MICRKDQRKFSRLIKFVAWGLLAATVPAGLVTAPALALPGQMDRKTEPWEKMDYGQFQCATIFANTSLDPLKLTIENQKYWSNKGMAIHLGDADHPAAILFDTAMLRYVAGWTGNFLKHDGVVFTGKHGHNPIIGGTICFSTINNPGWAKDGTDWTDPRGLSEYFEFPEEKEKREAAHEPPAPGEKVGALPREWGHYKGVYLSGNKTVLSYSIGDADILDLPQASMSNGVTVFTRTLNIGPSSKLMAMAVCELSESPVKLSEDGRSAMLGDKTAVAVDGESTAKLSCKDGRITLEIPLHDKPIKLRVAIASGKQIDATQLKPSDAIADLEPLTHQNVARWGDAITTDIHLGDDVAFLKGRAELAIQGAQSAVTAAEAKVKKAKSDSDRQKARDSLRQAKSDLEHRQKEAKDVGNPGAYVVDTIEVPFENPYHSWMRTAALDFFSDGRCAISTWSGDVWIVSFDSDFKHAHWKRFATGLFQPLGLKIVNDQIYVQGRDQITILHDLTHSGEANFYENFNNDVQVTSSFHEFSHDLQVDNEGNFYFAKGGPVRPGGRGWQQISRDNGTVIKISKDGKTLTTYAVGVRAPNGMGFGGPAGILSVGDNEGTWTPADRLDFIKQGDFLGVVDLCHSENKPDKPGDLVCWLPHNGNPEYGVVDNSNGAQTWVNDDRFGPFKDTMLYLSYGTCSMFHVSYEKVGDLYQGGGVKFPLSFDSGSMRLRINPKDGQPWVTGLKGWQTTAVLDGMLQRVRFTGKPVNMPLQWHVNADGVQITFTSPLDKTSAVDPQNWAVEQWNYHWTQNYGSREWSLKNPDKEGHDSVDIKDIKLSEDGKTVSLNLAQVVPVMQMRIKMDIKAADGSAINTNVFTTINVVPPAGAVSQR
jgi:hypothetical protein